MKKDNPDRLTQLFENFDPNMKSGDLFMSRLRNRMEEIEPVKSRIEASASGSRVALIATAVAGFIFGVVATLCYPFLSRFFESIALSLPAASTFLTDFIPTLGWLITVLTGLLISYTTYNLTRLLTCRE